MNNYTMKFNIDYDGIAEQRVLSYLVEDYSFDIEPWEGVTNVDLALNYLCLTVLGEDNHVIQVSGFCPYGEWIKTNHNVPQNRQGRLKITNVDDLNPQPGIGYGINNVHWPVYVNPDIGWVCIGNPESVGEAVEFINGCVAVISANSDFLSLWLKPKELPLCTENAIR
jgi:hypothetical protein